MEIIVGIASVPSRRTTLSEIVGSLRGQADKIFVALNGYQEIPQELLSMTNVECTIMDNSLGDGAKMSFASKVSGYYIAWDDDLVAPPDVVSKLISGRDYSHKGSLRRHINPLQKVIFDTRKIKR